MAPPYGWGTSADFDLLERGDLPALHLEDEEGLGLQVAVRLELDALRDAVDLADALDVLQQLGPVGVAGLDAGDEDLGRVVGLGGVQAGLLADALLEVVVEGLQLASGGFEVQVA